MAVFYSLYYDINVRVKGEEAYPTSIWKQDQRYERSVRCVDDGERVKVQKPPAPTAMERIDSELS
jgi:hypothetical protein